MPGLSIPWHDAPIIRPSSACAGILGLVSLWAAQGWKGLNLRPTHSNWLDSYKCMDVM